MKNTKLCIFVICTLTYFVPFAMCSGQHIKTKKYMNKLKAYIKDSKISLSSEQYTAFGIAKKGLTVNETLDIYQSLFGIPDRDGTMTVITIRNKNHSVIDNLEKCMESLVIAAQNFIYQKKQETFFDDLCVTIEYIQQDHIRDCGALSEACRQIEKVKNDFEAYIVSNLLKITSNSLRHLIFLLMHKSLGDRYKEFRIGINDKEKDKQEFVDFAHNEMSWRSRFHFSYELAEMASITPPDSFDSIFDELRSYILKYEKENHVYFFTGNDKEMIRFISITLDNHGYFVWQNLILINAEPQKFVNNAENEKLLRNILGYVYTKLIEYIRFKPRNNDRTARNWIWEKFVDNLSEDSEFKSKYQEFFSNVTSEKLGILEAEKEYPETVSEYAQEIRSDNAVRIIFADRLDESILCRLCSILRSTRIYNCLYANQSIYINFGSELTQDKLTDSYLKFQASCNEEKNATADDDYKFVAIEVYTTSKQMIVDLNNKVNQLMTYKVDSATVSVSHFCPICVECDRPSNETIIAIETPVKHEEYIERLKNLLNTSEKIDILNVILIENDFVKVRIYFTQEMADDMSEKMVSISFEVTKKPANDSTFGCQQPDTLFKTMKDVDDRIMVSLFRFIQRYHLTIGTEFAIPNLKSIDGIDYIYTESIFVKPFEHFCVYIKEHIAKIIHCREDTPDWLIFCNSDINKLDPGYSTKSPPQLKYFITKLDRDEKDILRVIREFVINRRIKEGSCKLHNEEFGHSNVQNVAIYATYIRGDCLVLNICEVNENAYINSLSTHVSKILAKVLAADFGCDALKVLVNEAKAPKHKMLLISEMINNVYMQQSLSSLRKEEMSISTEKTKYIRMFGKSLQAYIEDQNNQENLKYSYRHKLKDCLKVANIEKLVDFVFKEIESVFKRREVKVTSIRIGVKKEVPQKSFGLRCNIS